MPPYSGPSRRLVSQEDASMIARPDIPRSKFSGSWSRKTTFDAGVLVPFLVEEIYPGDHMVYDVSPFVRTSTPLFPIMDSQRVDTHFFFVPCRLVYTDFVKLMGEQANPGDSISYTIPQITSTGNGFAVGGLGDYFGLPTVGQAAAVLSVNALPFRAYQMIYNQWFRDENLINSVTYTLDGSAQTEANGVGQLRRRAKSADYFTSCLPWPQKFTAPTVPVGGYAPVTGIGWKTGSAPGGADQAVNLTPPYGVTTPVPTDTFNPYMSSNAEGLRVDLGYNGVTYYPQVFADLSLATGVSINSLRQSMLIQQLMEKDARGGTRYTELMVSHFGVRNPDARLDRAEYIGGGQSPLQFTPIAQTAPTAGVPLGALGAAGTAFGSHRASYAATEHGYIIGLVSVKSELSYSQGVHKMWDRKTRYDFYFPSTAGLGEQAVLRREIYATGQTANDDVVFGYQERWHELRTRVSEVTGLFRPTAASNIDEWHLSQQFSSAPTLGQTFIEDSPPMSRVLAAGALAAGQQYLADILIRREATRPVPMYGTPVNLGRF